MRVSDNGRFLVEDDGAPFFWLGDTAWAMLHQLTLTESEIYLRDRAAKGFTVIQTVALSEFDGLRVPNANGDLPLLDLDPTRPNAAYFRHVAAVIELAGSLGLTIALLPTWADKVGPVLGGVGPEVFTPENAATYGAFLGQRYRDAPVVWVIGGDRPPADPRYLAVWRAMAHAIRDADGGRGLMTYHPPGRSSSAEYLHHEPWLDFNMIQSGHHQRDAANAEVIARDYALRPVKPTLDAEPCYEDHPVNWQPEQGHFSAWDARKAAYWALFAGACGHTYGANSIFQFSTGTTDRFGARRPWQEALQLPGASQMIHARRLLELRPFLCRIPDQTLITSFASGGPDHIRATRCVDGAYAMVYLPTGKDVIVDLGKLTGDEVVAWWYRPESGEAMAMGTVPARSSHAFTPPTSGPGEDWVLVLDDASRDFPPPGALRP